MITRQYAWCKGHGISRVVEYKLCRKQLDAIVGEE